MVMIFEYEKGFEKSIAEEMALEQLRFFNKAQFEVRGDARQMTEIIKGFTSRTQLDGWKCNACGTLTHYPNEHKKKCLKSLQIEVAEKDKEIEQLKEKANTINNANYHCRILENKKFKEKDKEIERLAKLYRENNAEIHKLKHWLEVKDNALELLYSSIFSKGWDAKEKETIELAFGIQELESDTDDKIAERILELNKEIERLEVILENIYNKNDAKEDDGIVYCYYCVRWFHNMDNDILFDGMVTFSRNRYICKKCKNKRGAK